MQIFRGSQEEIKEKFNLNPLVIMSIGILKSKNIMVTEPLLELCKKGNPLENLMKDRLLISSIENKADFDNIQKKYNLEDTCPLVVLDYGKEKLLALSDEIIAETGWKNSTEISKKMDLEKSEIRLGGFENLFSKEEINNLKMTIATTIDSKEKIEAIRKISYSDVSLNEKGILFIHTLGDMDIDIRRESAQAFLNSGLNSEIITAIISLNNRDLKIIEYSINSLANLFENAEELEKGAILQSFFTILKDNNYSSLFNTLLKNLAKIVNIMPKNDKMVQRIIKSLLEVLVSHLDNIWQNSIKLVDSIKLNYSKTISEIFFLEIKKIEDRRLRAFLLILIDEKELSEEKINEIARTMAYEIGLGDELDPIYMRLTTKVLNLKDKAIEAFIYRFKESKRVAEKLQILSLIDNILSKQKISKKLKENIFEAYLDEFSKSNIELRSSILQSELLSDKDISDNLKSKLATYALSDISQLKLDQLYDSAKVGFCRMKKACIKPLIKVIKKPLKPLQAIRASFILGELVLSFKEDMKEEIIKIKNFCIDELETADAHKGEIFKILGKIVFTDALNNEMSTEIIDFLFANLCKSSAPFDILDSLGWASVGKFVDNELKIEICHLFCTLIDKKLPANIFQKKETDNNTIFEFNFKTTAYTELLPILISSMKKIALDANALKSLRQVIINKILNKWEEIVSFKIIWGPKNILDLAEAMREIALSPITTIKNKNLMIRALYKKVEIFSITELLTSIFEREVIDLSLDIVNLTIDKLIEFIYNEDYNNPEDKEVIYRCIGRVIKSRKLAKKEKESEEIREKLLYILFEGMREKIFGISDMLLEINQLDNISKKIKKEIQKRFPENFI